MDYKAEMEKQVETLRETQAKALECMDYEVVNDIANTIFGCLAQLQGM